MLILATSTSTTPNQIYFLVVLFLLFIWAITRFYVFSMENAKLQNIWMIVIVPFVIPSIIGLIYTIINFYVMSIQASKESFWSQLGSNIVILEILVFFWGIITWNSLRKGRSGGFFAPNLRESRYLKKLVEKMFIIPILLIILLAGLIVFNSK
jgi:hypothetical protein